ncbi:MAG: restriction endonuclease subunit S, partial [Verrucomicrobiales bacterium]|nr:restriction endonuclease subunit S [Verrucomicrobiales bacterium]
RPDPKKADARFLLYYFLSHEWRRVVEGFVITGATVDRIPLEKFPDFPVQLPKLSVQRQIAATLSAYDDLMENNRRRMVLLEESARLLYREWFVHLRFPGHEHTRVTNGLPQGWGRVPTPEAIAINPRIKLSDDNEHWYVEMADLPTDSMVIQSAIKREGRSGSKFSNGDTLFARITPCLENGKTGFVNFMEDGESGRGSTEFIVLRSKLVTPEFVYCLARTYDFRENAIKSMVGSSGRQRAQESCFEKFMVWCPPSKVLSLFSEFTVPVFEEIKNLHQQNQKLRTARELLLPRLMSGEIEM